MARLYIFDSSPGLAGAAMWWSIQLTTQHHVLQLAYKSIHQEHCLSRGRSTRKQQRRRRRCFGEREKLKGISWRRAFPFLNARAVVVASAVRLCFALECCWGGPKLDLTHTHTPTTTSACSPPPLFFSDPHLRSFCCFVLENLWQAIMQSYNAIII